jgi:hypothetical protein
MPKMTAVLREQLRQPEIIVAPGAYDCRGGTLRGLSSPCTNAHAMARDAS